MEDGLSNGSVNAILRDKSGFMWIGTSDGLNRYDGAEIRVFEHIPGTPHSLSANTISALLESANGDIWVGTSGGGISIYHPDSEQFTHYRHVSDDSTSLSSDYINVLYRGREGTIWVGTAQGLNRFVPDAGVFIRYSVHSNPPLQLSSDAITALWEAPSGTIWAGTEKGLNLIQFYDNGQLPAVTGFNRDTTHHFRLTSLNIKYIYEDPLYPGKVIWVATRNGLNRIELNDHPVAMTTFHAETGHPDSLSENFTTCLVRDDAGTLWVGTQGGGLNQLIKKNSKYLFVRHMHSPESLANIGGDKVTALYTDHKGLLWAGHETDGISQLIVPLQNASAKSTGTIYSPFSLHRYSGRYSGSLSSRIYANVITALYEDRHQNLWIGTEGSGCRKISPEGDTTWFFPETGNPASLSHSIVTTFTEDSQGRLWIGTFGGLNCYSPENQSFKAYIAQPDQPEKLQNHRIFATFFDEDGLLWMGTRGGGLVRFDPATEAFIHYLHDPHSPQTISNNQVWALLPEGSTHIWVGTDGGLDLFDKNQGTFQHFVHQAGDTTSLSNNFVNILFRDSKNNLWVGTDGGGINRMIRKGEKISFQNYTRRNGLPDNVIYGMEEDTRGNLWISTNRGLSRFSPDQAGETFTAFKNYDKNDGLQDNEFNNGAHFHASSGRLYFGGMNGYNSFLPDQIPDNPHPPGVIITRLRVLNETVLPGQILSNGSKPLIQSISLTQNLNLSYRDYVFSLEFAAQNYVLPGKNRYAYKLEGFDSQWIYSHTERKATYSNLSPGNYTFRVKACNNDGVWNESGTSLHIHISPPPWKTWWAYLLYIISAVTIMAGFIRYRDKARLRLENVRAEERERVRKNAAADFHDELGNKLTKINLFVELARRHAPEAQLATLKKVEQNVQALSEGVRDLIWVLDPEKDSFYDTMVHLKDFGDNLFEQTDMTFRTTGILPEWEKIRLSLTVRRHILLIFKEAMHNALKYAEGKEVVLNAWYFSGETTIEFQDSGKGMGKEIKGTGYGIKNMQGRAEKIGAEFSILSPKEGGTLVRLLFRLPHPGDEKY
ncbi:MAG: two-component regulator propeller domain-containing protein [Bacteroidia bacterium]